MTRRALLSVAGAARVLAAKTEPYGLAFSLKGFPKWPLEKAFAVCAQLGFNGVELFVGPKQEHEAGKLDIPALQALVRKHRLPVVTLMEDLRLNGDGQPGQLEHLEASLRLARQIDPRRPPLIETVVGGRANEWEQLRPLFLERLVPWARLAEKHRVVVAIKPHIASALHLPADGALLCDKIGSRYLKLNYDFSHFQLQGLALEASLRAELPHIAMIHIKDSTGLAPNHRFALRGEGNIDYRAYVSTLRKLNYSGPIVVEVSAHVLQRPGFDPETAARFVSSKVLPIFLKP
jgi:inosose dehydratase